MGGGFIPLEQAAFDLGVLDEMAMGLSFIDNAFMPAFFPNSVGTTSDILYYYTLPDNPINDWMIAAIAEQFCTFPDLFDADAMNASLLIAEALKATEETSALMP